MFLMIIFSKSYYFWNIYRENKLRNGNSPIYAPVINIEKKQNKTKWKPQTLYTVHIKIH